jgi:tetratricopeptide (TPR) repeat protein
MSRPRIVCLLLVLVTVLVYLPVRHHQFLNFDDGEYVSQNAIVQSGLTWAGIKWAFTTCHMSNWHPVTWLSHMVDCQLLGPHAGRQLLVNVAIHALNSALLFLLLLRLTGGLWRSALVAALFAWHPLHVESVAWVAERKDVLCALFGLLTLAAYVRYTRGRPPTARRESKAARTGTGAGSKDATPDARHPGLDYTLALLCFALGLMSKPMLVTLPVVLLLLDYWPLQRVPADQRRWASWRRLALEKWPFFALAAASGVMTFIAQRSGGSVAPLDKYPLDLRLENAAVSYVHYLLNTMWPANLAVIYPLPDEIPWWQTLGALFALGWISWWAWRGRRNRPYLLVGWLWYLVMLLPVIGLVQVGRQALADRYTYLPLVGVFLGVAFGAADLAARFRLKPAFTISVAGLLLAACLFGTARQLRFWKDSLTLFQHALDVTRNNYVAHNNVGTELMQAGDWKGAAAQFQQALALRPYYPEAWYNLGFACVKQGQMNEAVECFERLLKIQPDNAAGHNNLGTTLLQMGRVSEATAQFRKALEIQPDDVEALNNLGGTLMQNGQVNEAIAQFQKALKIQPRHAEANFNLGIACLRQRRVPEAIDCFRRALEIQPDYAKARHHLGLALLSQGRLQEAIDCFQQALKDQPGNIEVRNDLAWVLATAPDASVRNGARAVELAGQAARLSSRENPAILGTLAAAYAEAGRWADAKATARRALELATAHHDTVRVESLQKQIQCYESDSPFRDPSLARSP